MFNMIEKIDLYLKENNFVFDEIELDGSLFDDYFRLAVTNIIRRTAYKNHEKKLYFDDARYYLKRDIDNKLYILAISHDNRYKVIICDDLKRGVSISTDSYTSLFSQKSVMQDAAMYKILRNVRRRVRREIDEMGKYETILPLHKRKIEFKRMGYIFKHMYENNKGNLLTLYDQSEYYYNNRVTVNNIIDFISCFNCIGEIYSEDMTLERKK